MVHLRAGRSMVGDTQPDLQPVGGGAVGQPVSDRLQRVRPRRVVHEQQPVEAPQQLRRAEQLGARQRCRGLLFTVCLKVPF